MLLLESAVLEFPRVLVLLSRFITLAVTLNLQNRKFTCPLLFFFMLEPHDSIT